jgi:uracil phosphoribosyltransferase
VPARPPSVLSGAIVGAHLAAIRDARSADPAVRRSARALATLAVAEALRDLETVPGEVLTPVAPARITRLARRVTLVPVLRAGLVLLEPALDLLPPGTRVGFMGLSRDETTLKPRTYLESLPGQLDADEVVLLEVMIATGGSSVAALRALRAAGAERLHLVGLIAAPEGLETVAAAHPEVPITVAAVDERLDERGYIVPGLGDAGDRLYSEPG